MQQIAPVVAEEQESHRRRDRVYVLLSGRRQIVKIEYDKDADAMYIRLSKRATFSAATYD